MTWSQKSVNYAACDILLKAVFVIRLHSKSNRKFLLLVRGVRDQVVFAQQVAYSSKVAEISVSVMGWLGPCRQLGMPLEYSMVIIILGVLSIYKDCTLLST